MKNNLLSIGEPVPWFVAPSTSNPKYHFDTIGGRYIVLCFFGSAADPLAAKILQGLLQYRNIFDDGRCSFFGVSIDPQDKEENRVEQQLPGIRYFWDFDLQISKIFGTAETEPETEQIHYRRCTFILDTRLRVMKVFPFIPDVEKYLAHVIQFIFQLPPLPGEIPANIQAPVLIVPRIFEPELCQNLIEFYDRHGGTESGFMRDINGKTVGILDRNHKSRSDQEIIDEELRKTAMYRVHQRLAPEILKAYQFNATRIERHIVACYDSKTGGHFRPHRDNTTQGTAHRRFAVSINLNSEDYEGGDVIFPEFGRYRYRPPTGGALVFSCSLLHEVIPIVRGKRYVYLPFLYDEAAAKIREANREFLEVT
jgi:peroxiredoxin